ncbi:MAG: hypothetical protein WDA12_04830 [Bacilli bacterium]
MNLPDTLKDPKFRKDKYNYWYGNRKLRSMTSWLKSLRKPFDSEYWSKRKAEERGVDPSVILSEWKAKGDRSRGIGILVHEWIDIYFKGGTPDFDRAGSLGESVAEDAYKRYMLFHNLMSTRLVGASCVASELMLFSPSLGIAGAMDSLILDSSSRAWTGDWKATEKFTSGDEGFGKLLTPFEDLQDNDQNVYSLQVSLLRVLAEEHGMELDGGFIVHLPPDAQEAIVHFATDLRDPVREALQKTSTGLTRDPW